MNDNVISNIGGVVAAWWREQQPDSRGRGGDRGAIARLRRAASPTEALLEPAAVDLVRRTIEATGGIPLSEWRILALGTLAGVLARTRTDAPGQRFASILGANRAGTDHPLFSHLRFAALLAAPDWFARHRHLRRAVDQIAEQGFDIAAFSRDVFTWSDATRRRWTFEYYRIPVASSGTGAATEETTQ